MRKNKLGSSITKKGQSELFIDDQNIAFWSKILMYYWSILVMIILNLCRTKWSKKVLQCAVRGSGPKVVTWESLSIRENFFHLREGKHWQRCPGNWEPWPLEMFRAGLDRPWAFWWYCFEGWGWTKCLSEVPSQLNYYMSLWWIIICMLNFSEILSDTEVAGVEWKEMDLDIYAFSLIRGLCIWPLGKSYSKSAIRAQRIR